MLRAVMRAIARTTADGKKKTPVEADHQPDRKVGIRPFKVGQQQRACVMGVRMFVCSAALNGRIPTFRTSLVACNATGVFFFQGGCKLRCLPPQQEARAQQATCYSHGGVASMEQDVSERSVVSRLW